MAQLTLLFLTFFVSLRINFWAALICMFTLFACATQLKQPARGLGSYAEFRGMALGSPPDAATVWGEPTEKEHLNLGGRALEIWLYDELKDGARARIAIDPKTKSTVEKTYLPAPQSREANLQTLLEGEFAKVTFEKVPVKCRHENELILVSEAMDIFIVTRAVPNARVDAIQFTSPLIARSRLQENSSRVCHSSKKLQGSVKQ